MELDKTEHRQTYADQDQVSTVDSLVLASSEPLALHGVHDPPVGPCDGALDNSSDVESLHAPTPNLFSSTLKQKCVSAPDILTGSANHFFSNVDKTRLKAPLTPPPVLVHAQKENNAYERLVSTPLEPMSAFSEEFDVFANAISKPVLSAMPSVLSAQGASDETARAGDATAELLQNVDTIHNSEILPISSSLSLPSEKDISDCQLDASSCASLVSPTPTSPSQIQSQPDLVDPASENSENGSCCSSILLDESPHTSPDLDHDQDEKNETASLSAGPADPCPRDLVAAELAKYSKSTQYKISEVVARTVEELEEFNLALHTFYSGQEGYYDSQDDMESVVDEDETQLYIKNYLNDELQSKSSSEYIKSSTSSNSRTHSVPESAHEIDEDASNSVYPASESNDPVDNASTIQSEYDSIYSMGSGYNDTYSTPYCDRAPRCSNINDSLVSAETGNILVKSDGLPDELFTEISNGDDKAETLSYSGTLSTDQRSANNPFALRPQSQGSPLSKYLPNTTPSKTPHIPPPVIRNPETGEEEYRYPAPIPVKLNLPPLLSRKNRERTKMGLPLSRRRKMTSTAIKSRSIAGCIVFPQPPVWGQAVAANSAPVQPETDEFAGFEGKESAVELECGSQCTDNGSLRTAASITSEEKAEPLSSQSSISSTDKPVDSKLPDDSSSLHLAADGASSNETDPGLPTSETQIVTTSLSATSSTVVDLCFSEPVPDGKMEKTIEEVKHSIACEASALPDEKVEVISIISSGSLKAAEVVEAGSSVPSETSSVLEANSSSLSLKHSVDEPQPECGDLDKQDNDKQSVDSTHLDDSEQDHTEDCTSTRSEKNEQNNGITSDDQQSHCTDKNDTHSTFSSIPESVPNARLGWLRDESWTHEIHEPRAYQLTLLEQKYCTPLNASMWYLAGYESDSDIIESDCATIPSDDEYQYDVLVDFAEHSDTEDVAVSAVSVGEFFKYDNIDDFAFTSFNPNTSITDRGLLAGSISYSSRILPAVGVTQNPPSLIEELELRKARRKTQVQKMYYDDQGNAIAINAQGTGESELYPRRKVVTSEHPLDPSTNKSLLQLQMEANHQYETEKSLQHMLSVAVESERMTLLGIKDNTSSSHLSALQDQILGGDGGVEETLEERRVRLRHRRQQRKQQMDGASMVDYAASASMREEEDTTESLAQRRRRLKIERQKRSVPVVPSE